MNSSIPRTASCLIAAGLLLAPALDAQAIQLRDGAVLVGRVEDAHGEGLTYRKLTDGGVLELRWDHLAPHSAERIKQIHNLATEDTSELLIMADIVRYTLPGGGSVTVTGRRVPSSGGDLVLATKTGRVTIPRPRITMALRQEVPVLDVYTKEQFHTEKLQEIAPGDDADLHVQMAELLIRVRDYDRALEHLRRAEALGNSKQPQLLEAMTARVELFKEAAAERELLDEIGYMRERRRFPRGLELIAQFEEQFPDSRLSGEFEAEKQRFDKARERYYVGQVASAWQIWLDKIASKQAGESTSLDETRTWAETKMGELIREAVAEQLALAVEEAEGFWRKRGQYGQDRSKVFRYSIGSWVLGEERILANTEAAQQRGQERPSRADQVDEQIRRRIQEAVRRAGRDARGQQGAERREKTPDEWWQEAGRAERRVWIRAYYAEFGGDFELVSAYVDPCRTCGGAGTIESLAETGDPIKTKCPTCHGTRATRSVRVK